MWAPEILATPLWETGQKAPAKVEGRKLGPCRLESKKITRAKRPPTALWDISLQLFVCFQVKDARSAIKTSLWLLVVLTERCCWCCAHRTGPASANHGRRRREEAGGASVTANGPWWGRSRSHSSSVEATVSRSGSRTSDWAFPPPLMRTSSP